MTQIYTRPVLSPLHGKPLFESTPDHYTSRPQYQTSPREESKNSQPRWISSQSRSPMSIYKKVLFEVTSPKLGRSPQEDGQPRESLPSLSSIFGGATQRPTTGFLGRRSLPSHSVTAEDSRYPPVPAQLDTSRDFSSFSRTHSFDTRTADVERLGLPPPPPRTSQQQQQQQQQRQPVSPRYDSRHGVLDSQQRTQPALAPESWSPLSQSGRTDFLVRDNPFRSHLEPYTSPMQRPDPERLSYSDPQATPTSYNFPPTPGSTIAGDSTTSKDALGPKIWTGTHFLPRFVRQAEVPGEGMCYFYDDGTHCKTVIDGEVVNAHWGVTKAGKPRKRLAIACITCREKKIKCDPDYPRCVQCEKFGRVCKFKNAPRGGQGSPETPPAEPEESLSRPSSRGDESITEKREHSQSVSPRKISRHETPDSESRHAKRQRNSYTAFTPLESEASPHTSMREALSPSSPLVDIAASISTDSNMIRCWSTNPYTAMPEVVTELLNSFFSHAPETAYCMFSEGPFKKWVFSPAEKSREDNTLIYSILMLGTIFSPNPEHKALAGQFSAFCRHGCENQPLNLQLVQSRLLLALYYFANNHPELAWDLCGGAMRAASGIKLNLELEKTEEGYWKTFPYGLTRGGYAECRRRTFWSCYILDRFNGFCSGHLSVIQPEDIFLRLPCDANSFESQLEVQNPFFDPSTPPIHNPNWTIGSLGYLINIATIWSDIVVNIYRSSQRPNPPSSTNFIRFYEGSNQRLREWNDSLPSYFTFSPENSKRAADSGKLGTFMTMHAVYHNAVMKLNRYVPVSVLTSSQIAHHTTTAKYHAEALLVMMDTLAGICCSPLRASSPQQSLQIKFSSPSVGYAIVSAVDILTAKLSRLQTTLAGRLASFRGAQAMLNQLSQFWQSSMNQQALVQQRLAELSDLAFCRDDAVASASVRLLAAVAADGSCALREPIEKNFSREYDCVYL